MKNRNLKWVSIGVSHANLAGYIKRLLLRLMSPKSISRFRFPGFISPIKDFFLWVSNRFSYSNCPWPWRFENSKFCPEAPAECMPDLQVLNCRVKLTKQGKDNGVSGAFAVEICGSIYTPDDLLQADTTLRISIMDITEGAPRAQQVQTQVKQWSALGGQDSSAFCYHADLGKLPNRVTTLSDWTAIAQLCLDWLMFPHKGKRTLQFITSIFAQQSGQELACATCTFTYESPEFGYINLQENIQRTKTLAVALAFAVSAADKKLYKCEIELIKNWARENILENSKQVSKKTKRKIYKALDKTVAFFRDGNHLNIYKICKEIVEIAPLADRYNILELCLYAAGAKGFAVAEELDLLKNLATWLEVDTDRFQEMTERILPVNMHKVKDVEVILGVTADMNKERTRLRLNKQYSKWNSRVTNADPAIRAQADQMIKLIAEARNEYIG